MQIYLISTIKENMMSETVPRAKKKTLLSWSFYDWANSSFSAIIETFVLPAYFVKAVVGNEELGSEMWGFALGITGFIIAIGGPILGAIADQAGHRKRWLFSFTYLTIIACALMWFITPGFNSAYLALILFSLATMGSEFAYVFYNAMLPDIAPPSQIGKWSGYGWALGYVGGMLSLVVALFFFIDPNISPIPFDRADHEDVRASLVLVAAWYAIFSIPIFLFTPTTPHRLPVKKAVVTGLIQLKNSFLDLKRYGSLFRFFIARMFFVDGLLTLFAFGGIYAATQFHMSEEKILIFGIVLNVTAGIGAALFALLDDKFGSRLVMIVSLISLILLATFTLLAQSEAQFWVAGMLVGMFVGPVQASSRAYLAKVAPPELMNQMFGFFSLSGKATSFLGPLVVSTTIALTGSLVLGMSTIVLFFILGLMLLLTVKEAKIES